jgi:hypothetical protein
MIGDGASHLGFLAFSLSGIFCRFVAHDSGAGLANPAAVSMFLMLTGFTLRAMNAQSRVPVEPKWPPI